MPTIETNVWVSAPLETVYAVAKDNASFPEFMEDVESLSIVEQSGPKVVSDWVGKIPSFGLKVRWRQEDLWNDDDYTCSFRQVSGDYDRMDGIWQFAREGEGTRFSSILNYEYNVPAIGSLIKKIIHGIVKKNMDGVLNAIKERAEKSA